MPRTITVRVGFGVQEIEMEPVADNEEGPVFLDDQPPIGDPSLLEAAKILISDREGRPQ